MINSTVFKGDILTNDLDPNIQLTSILFQRYIIYPRYNFQAVQTSDIILYILLFVHVTP